MNIFVLCTGRCGSTTFIKAAEAIGNYTAGHESRGPEVGPSRLAYPADHIEADNRLSWLLGRLDREYGDAARYVHLRRDPEAVALSFTERWRRGIINAYRTGILFEVDGPKMAVCRDYVDTVTANISSFLKDKTHVLDFELENAGADWPRFWDWANAEGDYDASVAAWSQRHNESRHPKAQARREAYGETTTQGDFDLPGR